MLIKKYLFKLKMRPDEFYKKREAIGKEFLSLLKHSKCSEFTLKCACANLDITEGEMDIIFPLGLMEVVEFLFKKHKEELEEKIGFLKEGVSASVKNAILESFSLLTPFKREIIKILRYLAMSSNFLALTKFPFKIADSIWNGIGSKDTTFSYYTKRLSLAGIYTTSFIYFLAKKSEESIGKFVDLQLRMLGKITKLKNKLKNF